MHEQHGDSADAMLSADADSSAREMAASIAGKAWHDKGVRFAGVMVLAPMVRVGTLPLRLLALENGADLVWTEEMVAKKVAPCERIENLRLGTVEFYDKATPWTRVWQTCPQESCRVVFQIGASEPADAVAAIRVVAGDVAAVCLNMGCPKEFSVKNGMGAALLKKPHQAMAIIRALKASFPTMPVVAKIRLLDTVEDTVALMRSLEQAGCAAISVHVRHVSQRSSVPAHRAQLPALVAAVSIPVIGNGDVVDFADGQKWREESGCAGIMVARMAAENPSCFRREGRLPQADMLRRHVDKCIEYEEVYQVGLFWRSVLALRPDILACPIFGHRRRHQLFDTVLLQNMKYFYNHFFTEVCVPGGDLFESITRAKSRKEIAALLHRQSYFEELDIARGRGGKLEAQGWWKGHKVHPEHEDYKDWLAAPAPTAGDARDTSNAHNVGEKRLRSGSHTADNEIREDRAEGSAGEETVTKTFVCTSCDSTFRSRNALFKHIRSAKHA